MFLIASAIAQFLFTLANTEDSNMNISGHLNCRNGASKQLLILFPACSVYVQCCFHACERDSIQFETNLDYYREIRTNSKRHKSIFMCSNQRICESMAINGH